MIPNLLNYPDSVWRLFRETPRAGCLDPVPGLVEAEASNSANRFRLRLQLRYEQGRVVDSRFQALGCPYTIAVGAWLAERVLGCQAGESKPAQLAGELRAALEIPEDRAHCWVMAQDVLRALQQDVSS